MNDRKDNQYNDSNSNHQLVFLALIGVSALLWKNEGAIRLWFYKNIIFMALGGLSILGLIGMYLWHRFKKKESEYFERRRNLRQVEASSKNINYYKRKDF